MGFNQRYPFKYAPEGILLNKNDRFITGAIREHGEYSEEEVDMFRDILTKDDIVIEVGANMGAHTLALANLAAGVIAFEPQRYMFQVLCANLANNSVPNVVALPYAVGANDGEILVPVYNPETANFNFGGVSLTEQYQSGETALKMSLDRLNLSELTLLKLDCEGMELDVLQGAVKLIERTQPWIYTEFTSSRKEILDFLTDLGYKAFRHWPQHTREPNFLDTPKNPDDHYASDMVLAIPANRIPKPTMEKGFGERHNLVLADTEDYFGKAVASAIWEPYVRTV